MRIILILESWRSRHLINDSFIIPKIKNQIMESSFFTSVTCQLVQPLTQAITKGPNYRYDYYKVMQVRNATFELLCSVKIRNGYVNQFRTSRHGRFGSLFKALVYSFIIIIIRLTRMNRGSNDQYRTIGCSKTGFG